MVGKEADGEDWSKTESLLEQSQLRQTILSLVR
eukprot:CAMPEP_0175370452 /NCGR_PEP_ID=MMETSP0095-20121207/21213_1 /TAXON_ID=311494 /ORGANISM="Alexandrium monilatum, Strain CCMP3105" /LENGTH=32 /DNA_ID= /DNA_START= /DNA_END= /DNA_ORIENTATION=